MTGEIAAAGDITTGALLARAVEPRAGEGTAPGHGQCLNCGTVLDGAFCHACGQTAHVHKTMASIGHDILHGVFHFEGKTWRTLPMLALHPGDLTRRYIAGERARFVSPMAAFLFSVFLLFAVVGSLPGWNFGESEFLKPGVAAELIQARTKLAEERARADSDLKTQQAKLAKEQADAQPDAERIASLKQKIATATRRATIWRPPNARCRRRSIRGKSSRPRPTRRRPKTGSTPNGGTPRRTRRCCSTS